MRRLSQQVTTRTAPTVAVYLRYSDEDNQRFSSIEDQNRICREAALAKGLVFDSSLVFVDAGLSGETLSTRPGLLRLLEAAQEVPRKFDGILIVHTSRLGRNTALVLQICNLLKYHGVFLYFVSQNLDSREGDFDDRIVPKAAADQQFNQTLRDGVVRGMEGRILSGYAAGGSHFGYQAEIVPDPSRRGSIARPPILGVKLVIDPVEAHTIRRIFDIADDGLSYKNIAARCASENLPLPPRSKAKTWTKSLVFSILHNERYRGRQIWGQTTTMKHPETGKMKTIPVPESEWTVQDVPELAIVSSEQFERVQQLIASHKKFGIQQLGGIGRRKDSRVPLFSGNMICKECKESIVVVGKTDKGDRTLQCSSYSQRHKSCTNSLIVSENTLESTVVNHLVSEVLRPELLEFTIDKFHEALQHQRQMQAEEAKSKRAALPSLNREKRLLERSIKNVVDSLIQEGSSKVLRAKLDSLEARLDTLQKEQVSLVPIPALVSLNEAKSFVLEHTKKLADTLLGNRNAAQIALRKHVGRLTLTPVEQNGLPYFKVTAGVQFFFDETNGMPSGNLSLLLQQWKDFRMEFVLFVPARTHKRDPLTNNGCDPTKLANLIAAEASVAEIAETQQTTKYLVRRALRALNLKPMPKPKVDYLKHRRCSADDVVRLRKQRNSCAEIGTELGVSKLLIEKILKAVAKAKGQKFERFHRSSYTKRTDYLSHPRCPVDEVTRLRKAGIGLDEIAKHFNVTFPTLLKVIRAIEASTGKPLLPAGRKMAYRPPMDYLAHPLCPASKVDELQKQGFSMKKIGSILGVSHSLVFIVSRALRDPLKRYRAPHRAELDLRTGEASKTEAKPKMRVISPETRKRMAEAQHRRWANKNGAAMDGGYNAAGPTPTHNVTRKSVSSAA